MNDPILNCALEICCGPEKAEQHLARAISTYCGDELTPENCASFILQCFDLAEKGTLKPFKDSVARLARGASPKD